MEASALYRHLDRDFILPHLSDDWSEIAFDSHYTERFQSSYMGLALDNAWVVRGVYTAVFASPRAIETLLERGVTDALLFTHHPMAWDIGKNPVFTQISDQHLKALKSRRIALYNLHVPLDRNSGFSTSVNLARAMNANVIDGFFDYHGAQVGVIAQVAEGTVAALMARFERALGHPAKVYQYGNETIDNRLVAFVGGGGNQAEIYEYLAGREVGTYVTGITSAGTGYQPALDAHDQARKHRVNVLGGTHYSTEKFALIKMTEYFARHGLPCEFIEDVPCMGDL